MEQRYLDAMRDYLEALLHTNQPKTIDKEDLPEAIRGCAQQFEMLTEYVRELHGFSGSIAAGNLEAPAPSRGNALCWEFKSLRSNLRHLTWQAQQIAKGDYMHRVQFMGEFSGAFNEMVETLEMRRINAEHSASNAEQRSLEREEMQNALRYIMDQIDGALVVIKPGSGRTLFRNAALRQWYGEDQKLIKELRHHLFAYDREQGRNWQIHIDDGMRAFDVISFPISWQRSDAMAHLISDISSRNAYNNKIEKEANTDPMTGLYNRRYCTKQIERLLAEDAHFCVCFVDLNDLKSVNDQFGHAEGDRYILRTSKTFLKVFRRNDIVCRYAGDEFIIILVSCTKSDAERRMEEAIRILSNYRVSVDYAMGFCYGIEEVQPGQPKKIQEVIHAADTCMYTKKREFHGAFAD